MPAFIEFLQCCAASRSPRWYPQISFRRGEPPTGEVAGGFETVSIAHDANGHPPDWDKVRRWIEERQGHGNFYWPNPARTVAEANRAPAVGQEATTKADKASILLPKDPDVKVPESVRRLSSEEPTGLADEAFIAAVAAKASNVVPQDAGPVSNVVGKSAPVERQKEGKANAAKGEKFKPSGKCEPTLLLEKRKPLKGGTYSHDEALKLLNSHYLIGKTEQEIAIFRIKDDGSLAFTPPEQFKLDVANIFVRLSSGSDKPVEKFWRESSRRHERKIVFKPGGTTQADEFNLWSGFGDVPRRTR